DLIPGARHGWSVLGDALGREGGPGPVINYVLAADPGLTTGWATMSIWGSWHPSQVSAGQLGADMFCDWVASLPAGGLWVVESFTITAATARMSQQPTALEVIGVLKFLARRSGCRLEMQRPGDAKMFCTDKQLRKIGLWKPG